MKLHIGAQFDFPGFGIDISPRQRKTWLGTDVFIRNDEPIKNVNGRHLVITCPRKLRINGLGFVGAADA